MKRMRTAILFLVLTLVLSAGPLAAAPLGERSVLENGMVLLHAERHTLPIVNVVVQINAGSVREPEEKAGLANLTADLLNEGTTTRTARQISQEIEFVGGSLSTSGGNDGVTVSLTVLKKDIALGMQLLADIIMHPAFREEEVSRRKSIIRNSILQQKEDPGTVASKAFLKEVYGRHPYGWPVEGTEETVGRLTREDVVRFYETHYAPNSTILSVVGDVTRQELLQILSETLLRWPRKDVPKVLPAQPQPKEKKTVVTVDRDLTQASLILGHLGVARDNPEYYAVTVMNYILGGGGFASRLMDNIRDNRGLAYDVNSSFSAGKYAGAFRAGLQTKNESANLAIAEILREMDRMRSEPVTDAELRDAKAYLTGSFPLKIDSNRKIAGFLTAVELYGLGLDYVDEYPRLINAVTREDVLRVARKYLDPEHYVLVVVGNLQKVSLNY